MKKLLLAVSALLLSMSLFAQNNKADNILGTYDCGTGKDAYKVKITKLSDGAFKGTVCWTADLYDEAGKIKAVNHGATKLLGQSSISLCGRSIKNVLPPNLDFFRETVYSDVRMNINGETHVMKIYFFKCRQTLMTIVNVAFFMDQSKTLLLQQNLKTLNEQYVEYTHDLVRYQDRLNKEASIKVEKENVLNTLINALPFRVWYKSELGVYQKQNRLDLEKRGSREGARDNDEDISVYEKEAREKGEVKVYTSFEDKDGSEISQDEANRLTGMGELVQTFDNMYIPILQAAKAPYKTLCLKVDMTEQRRLEYERNMLREQKFIHSRLEELGTICARLQQHSRLAAGLPRNCTRSYRRQTVPGVHVYFGSQEGCSARQGFAQRTVERHPWQCERGNACDRVLALYDYRRRGPQDFVDLAA